MKLTCFTLGILQLLVVGNARPQESFHPEPPVQKRVGFRVETREILEKIDEVNKKHGFIPKIKAQKEENGEENRKIKGISFDEVFANPILEYLKRNEGNKQVTTYSIHENDEDNEENGLVKRKITHQQTIFLPQNDYQFNYQFPQNNYQFLQSNYRYPPPYYQQPGAFPVQNQEDLEGITVDNIKNLVKASHSNYPNYKQTYYPTYYYPLPPGNYFKASLNPRQATINMPFQEYFPIVIRNPFQMMFNAFTSMVEYGQAVSGNCKSDLRKRKKLEEEVKESKKLEQKEIGNKESSEEEETVKGIESTDSSKEEEIVKEIESRESSEEEETVKEIESRELSGEEDLLDNEEEVVVGRKRAEEGVFKPSNWINNKLGLKKTTTTTLKPINYDKLGEAEELVTNFSSSDKGFLNALHRRKSGISRDNTGSGIFIHKLKVRQGGVAIAGPGGIATAGSGGTAIVGPNGLAFTHPDSLAIAGSGTKVVAVDPAINLSDLINNKTRFDGSSPRVGKVVATGPVIYYNRG